MEHSCIIGLMYDYENSRLMTLDGLLYEIKERKEMDEFAAKDPLYSRIYEPSKYTLRDYCDWRKSTDLRRFRYCPDCGKEIDWKAIRRCV